MSAGLRWRGAFFYVFLRVFRAWEADFVGISRMFLQLAFLRMRDGKQILSLFHVNRSILLISGQAWEADFDAIYGDRAHFGHLVHLKTSSRSRFCRYLTFFAFILVILLISGQAWEAVFDAIYGDPAHFGHLVHLGTSLGSRFSRYLRYVGALAVVSRS